MEQQLELFKYYEGNVALKFINENFESIYNANQSYSQGFFTKLYVSIFEDSRIDETEQALIINLIKKGFTTSITNLGQIYFNGEFFKLQGDDQWLVLEGICHEIITNSEGCLAFQFKQYSPLFQIHRAPDKGGMREADVDRARIPSLIDESCHLSTSFNSFKATTPDSSPN